MASRYELHDELTLLLGSTDCYYQPPESLKLRYPCFIYELENSDVLRADDLLYRRYNKYGLTYITDDPDDPLINAIEGHFRMCKFVRSYSVDNLHHFYHILYY